MTYEGNLLTAVNISSEKLILDDNLQVTIDYVNDDDSDNKAINGRFTSKLRRVKLIEDNSVKIEKTESNPYFDDRMLNVINDVSDDKLQVIDEGLSLEEIKKKISNNESYLVILWKKGNPPLPVDLCYHRDITLRLIDNSTSTKELTFNVINIVRSQRRWIYEI